MDQSVKLENLKQEMDSLNTNILPVCERKRGENNDFRSDYLRTVNTGKKKNETGIRLILEKSNGNCEIESNRIGIILNQKTRKKKYMFRKTLTSTKAQVNSDKIIMGKLKGDIKMEQDSEIVRKLQNVPEETWVHWNTATFQRITTT